MTLCVATPNRPYASKLGHHPSTNTQNISSFGTESRLPKPT